MNRAVFWLAVVWACGLAAPLVAGEVSGAYTDLPQSTNINLTADGNRDWVKWGNGETQPVTPFSTVRKSGVSAVINSALTPVGTSPAGTQIVLVPFAGTPRLNFNWSDGTAGMAGGGPVGTVVSQTILPAQTSYPLGIGQSFTVQGAAQTCTLDVYVQGFNSDMLIQAVMSGGGSAQAVVSPTKNPQGDTANDYSFGRYRIEFSGAGETLTVSVRTQAPVSAAHASNPFANAGFFAAALNDPTQPAGENWTFNWPSSNTSWVRSGNSFTSVQAGATWNVSSLNLFILEIVSGSIDRNSDNVNRTGFGFIFGNSLSGFLIQGAFPPFLGFQGTRQPPATTATATAETDTEIVE